ncbi:hypothetical protein [Chitinimonas lacunae]|uniref:Uncharacterized protein n=1 Tax=Chitinimonas lacunae TaxID=1963018 RepID=A0ABV8MM28_9NEIS
MKPVFWLLALVPLYCAAAPQYAVQFQLLKDGDVVQMGSVDSQDEGPGRFGSEDEYQRLQCTPTRQLDSVWLFAGVTASLKPGEDGAILNLEHHLVEGHDEAIKAQKPESCKPLVPVAKKVFSATVPLKAGGVAPQRHKLGQGYEIEARVIKR